MCPQARIPRDIDALTKPELLAAIASAGVGRENERIAQLYYVERLPKMDAGVRKMQKEHNLGVDGIIGKNSWTYLLGK